MVLHIYIKKKKKCKHLDSETVQLIFCKNSKHCGLYIGELQKFTWQIFKECLISQVVEYLGLQAMISNSLTNHRGKKATLFFNHAVEVEKPRKHMHIISKVLAIPIIGTGYTKK